MAYQVGQKIHHFTIVEFFSLIKNNYTRKFAKCLCNCGQEFSTRLDSIKCGDTTSCGCNKVFKAKTKRLNLINKRFGKLIVLEMTKTNNNNTCLCLCDCGNTKTIRQPPLVNGSIKSCGCEATISQFKKTNESNYKKSARVIFSGYKDEDLAFSDFLLLSQQNCHYCNKSPANHINITNQYSKYDLSYDFTYNGLDRLDPLLGHFKNNVVPCCIECNRGKNNLEYHDFLNKINLIYVNFIASGKYKLLKNKDQVIAKLLKNSDISRFDIRHKD